MPRPTKAELLRDQQIHHQAIANYVNSWLKYWGFKVGARVVPVNPKAVQTKIDPRQYDLFSTSKPHGGTVTGVVCFGSRSLVLVRLDGEKESYAYQPSAWKNELDLKP